MWKIKVTAAFNPSMRRFAPLSIICTILKMWKNTHEGVLFLVKLQAEAYDFTKSNTPPCVFLTFFKLYKWYQIAQSVSCWLGITSVMSSCAWPYPWNWTKLNSGIYEYLTTYKKSTLYLNSFWDKSLILITFGIPKHAWPYSRKLAKWICCFYHFTPLLVREITDFRESSIILFGREFL